MSAPNRRHRQAPTRAPLFPGLRSESAEEDVPALPARPSPHRRSLRLVLWLCTSPRAVGQTTDGDMVLVAQVDEPDALQLADDAVRVVQGVSLPTQAGLWVGEGTVERTGRWRDPVVAELAWRKPTAGELEQLSLGTWGRP